MFARVKLSSGNQTITQNTLIDSGASPNLVQLKEINKMGKNMPKINTQDKLGLSAANDSNINCLGSVMLKVNFHNVDKTFYWKFYVCSDLAVNSIIGRRSLYNSAINILTSQSKLQFDNKQTAPLLNKPKSDLVISKASIKVKANSHQYIKVYKKDKHSISGDYFINPANTDSPCQLVNFKRKSNNTVMLICNNSKTDRYIKKGETLGTASVVSDKNMVFHTISKPQLQETINVVTTKKTSKIKKPSFSRPLKLDDTRTDEQIIRAEAKFDKSLLSEAEQEQLYQILIRNSKALSLRNEIGRCNSYEYNIELVDNPTYFYKPGYNLSNLEKELIDKEIVKLVKLGVIRESQGSPVLSPALLTSKSDGSARFLVDLRALNKIVKPSQNSFTAIDDLINEIGLSQSTIFASLDFSEAFFQIGITENSRKYTAFNPYRGSKNFEFCSLPQGARFSPSAMTQMIRRIFSSHKYTSFYADDGILRATQIPEHFQNLEKFLSTLIKHNVKCSLIKSDFLTKNLEWIGHSFKNGTVSPQEKHVKAIREFPRPQNKQALVRFLAVCQWLRKFIPNLSLDTKCLYELCKQNTKYEWTNEHETKFQKIKQNFQTTPILFLPSKGKMVLMADASTNGFGAILIQLHPDNPDTPRIIGYFSKRATVAESKLPSATLLEILGIYYAIKHFHNLLFGLDHFCILTDNSALKSIFKSGAKFCNRTLAFGVLSLQHYNFQILHVPGKINSVADALSRDFDLDNYEVLFKNTGITDHSLQITEKILPVQTRSATKKAEETTNTHKNTTNANTDTNTTRRSKRLNKEPIVFEELKSHRKQRSDKGVRKNITQSTPSTSTTEITEQTTHKPSQQTAPTNTQQSMLDMSFFDELQAFDNEIEDNRPLAYKSKADLTSDSPYTLQQMLANNSPVHRYDTIAEHADLANLAKRNKQPVKPMFELENMKFTLPDKFSPKLSNNQIIKIKETIQANINNTLCINDVITAYGSDPYFRDIYQYIKHRILPRKIHQARRTLLLAETHFLCADLLFKTNKRNEFLLCIPNVYAQKLIFDNHHDVFGSFHYGFKKSFAYFSSRYYVHNMANIIKKIISSCTVCSSMLVRKDKDNSKQIPLQAVRNRTPAGPFQFIQADFAERLHVSKNHKAQDYLIIVCEYSSYTWIIPCEDKTAISVAKGLESLRANYSDFQRCTTDRGSSFANALMHEYARLVGADLVHHTAFLSQATGMVERQISKIREIIRAVLISKPQAEIAKYISEIQLALNIQPHEHSNMSPFEIFRGFKPRFNESLHEQAAKRFPTSKLSFEDLQEERSINEEIIRQGLLISRDKMIKRHNDDIKEVPSFQIGDLVKVRSFGSKRDDKHVKKIRVKYRLPMTIFRLLPGEGALLSDLSGNIQPDVYPLRRLVKLKQGLTDNLPFKETITMIDHDNNSQFVEVKNIVCKRKSFDSSQRQKILVEPVLETPQISRKFRFWLPC